MDKKIDAVMRELWNSALEALAHLSARDERFNSWKLKSGYISYNESSANLRFKELGGRISDARISLVRGHADIDEQIKLNLQMLVT